MKKKLILMGVAAALVTTTIIGGTLAATTYKNNAEDQAAEITTESLSLSLLDGEETAYESEYYVIAEEVIPGQTISQNRIIYNDGAYPFFVRVTIDKRWLDRREQTNDGPARVYAAEALESLGSGLIHVVPGDNWIQFYGQEENQEQIVLYYKYAVTPETVDAAMSSTTSFLKEIGIDATADNAYADQAIQLDVRVDAVQSDVGEDAIATMWGVFPTIVGNEITAISETN